MSNASRAAEHAQAGSELKYRPDIDGLRALAVLGVLAYHFGLGVPGGYGGVDVFFVISGFLIAGIIKAELEAGTFSLAKFYVRRIRRILPALAVCALVSTVFAALLLFPIDFKGFARSLFAVATSTSNFYFMRGTGYFEGPATDKPLLHTWSLGVEEQFYAAFPLLLMVLFARSRKLLVPVLLAVAISSLAYSIRDVKLHPQQAFFSTSGRIWELLIGALLAFGAVPELRSRFAREGASILGAGMIAAAYFVYSDATEFPGIAAVPFCFGAAFVIHSGIAKGSTPTVVARCLAQPAVVALGIISYSVYLWHWPMIVFFKYRFPLLWDGDGAQSVALRALLMLASIGIGALSWRFIEQPFRRLRTETPRLVFASGGAVVTALALLSFAAGHKPGWFQHWSPEVLADLASASANGLGKCERQPNAIGWPSKTCRLGSNGSLDTIIWGDSHAQRLTAGISASGQADNRSFLVETYGGCPPLVGVTLYGRSRSVKCPAFNDAVIRRAGAGDIKRVVLAARWGLYAEGLRGDDDGGAAVYLSNDGVSRNAAIFAAQLEETVRELTATGLEVVIVGPVPENVFNASLAFARHRAWNEPLPQETALSDFFERERHVLPVLAKLDAMPNVRVLYPHLLLCDEQACRYGKGGRPLYRDANHLNADGLAEIASLYSKLVASDAMGFDQTADSAFSSEMVSRGL